MRIFKSFHAYEHYLNRFYFYRPFLKDRTFNDQKCVLSSDYYPWTLNWSANNLNNKIEIFETIHNCEYLQRAWMPHMSFGDSWQKDIITEQIKLFEPDVCVLYPPELFDKEYITYLRSTLRNSVLFCSYDGMNRQNTNLYDFYDLVLTCSSYISDFYKSNGIKTYTLPFSFDESVLGRINFSTKNQYEVGFTGSIFENVHKDRYELLKELTKDIKIEIRSDFGMDQNYSLFSKMMIKKLLKERSLDNYFGYNRVVSSNIGAVYGIEMFQFLNDSRISLNLHGDNIYFSANVRLFEITGVGSLLLTDWKENLNDLFIDGKEVISFYDYNDARSKLKFYSKNHKLSSKIAAEGQKRTLSNYNSKVIINELFDYFLTII